MQTVEIRREGWPQALAQFSAAHDGSLVSVDVLGSELGAQPQIHDLPLVGVVAEPQHGGNVTIAVAASGIDQMTHLVQSPARIWIERTDSGADVALQIEAAEGTKTIVRLTAPL